MLNYLDTLKAGDKVAIYDDRTRDYTIAEVDEIFETQIYVKNSWYAAHIAFRKTNDKSIDKTNQWRTLCSVTEAEQLKWKAAEATTAKEVAAELAEAQRKSESKARKAKLITLLSDDAVSVDSDNTLEKCWETIIGY